MWSKCGGMYDPRLLRMQLHAQLFQDSAGQRKSRIEKLSHSTDTSAIRADGPNGFIGSTNKAFCRNS